MGDIMLVAQWLKLTDGGRLSIRSSELKQIDAALAVHEKTPSPANLDSLRSALIGWMGKEGSKWKTSVRNRYGAVNDLYHQVMGLPGPGKTGADMVALSHIKDESRAIVSDLFRGKTLEWRPGLLAKLNTKTKTEKLMLNVSVGSTAKNVHTLVKTVHGGGSVASSGGSAADVVKSICKALIPEDIFAEAWSKLLAEVPSFVTEFAASITPFIGVIASGGSALWSGIKLAQGQYRIHSAHDHLENSLSADEPKKAIEALIRILERERNNLAAKTAIDATAFGGKLASVLADGGTATNAAIGLAATTAKIAVFIHAFIRDFRERKAANRLMGPGLLIDGAELFDTSPVVGAYLICCVPTSVMVNSIFDRFYEQGWRGEVEYAVRKHIEPLREQARRVVNEHRFWIPSLQNYPGMVEKNKKKLKEMAKKKGKTGMVGHGPEIERLDAEE